MLLEVSPIHPVVDYPQAWWFAVGACVLLAVAVLALGIWRWRSLRPAPNQPDSSLEQLRATALQQLDEDARNEDSQAACQAMSRTVRRFVGTASGGDADYASAAQLREASRLDPRLQPVSDFINDIQEACFSPSAARDVDAISVRAQEVVAAWR